MSVVSNNGGLNVPATLLSPVFPFASSTCQIKFWYITSGGENTYSLNVSLVIDEERKATLFRKSSLPQVVSWTQHTIDLGSVSSKFQIAFEGRRAFFFNNFVSIDDITFERCALPFTNATCSNAEFKCKRGNCVSKERLCDFVDDCGDLSDETAPVCLSYSKCTFDFSLCDWQLEDPMASFKWIRFTGPTLSDLTGPSRGLFSLSFSFSSSFFSILIDIRKDHTSGLDTGSYLYLPSQNNQNKKARVISRTFVKQDPDCSFIYYYHMLGVSRCFTSFLFLNSRSFIELFKIEKHGRTQSLHKIFRK
jgi:hypothetical protein